MKYIVSLLLTISIFAQETDTTKIPCEDPILIELENQYSQSPNKLSIQKQELLLELQKDCLEYRRANPSYKRPEKILKQESQYIPSPCEDSRLIVLEKRYAESPDYLSLAQKELLLNLQKDCLEYQKANPSYKRPTVDKNKEYLDKFADTYDKQVSGFNIYLILSGIATIISTVWLLTL